MMRYKRHTRAAAVMTAFLLLGGVAACANDDGAHTHEYGEWIDEVRATCTEGGTLGHYSCDGCGKNFDADKNELAELDTPARGHTFGSTLTYVDCTGHYYAASCGHTDQKKDFAPHALEPSDDGKTLVCECGYSEADEEQSLAKPAGLKYENFIFGFDAVENATAYELDFVARGGVKVKTLDLTEPSVDLKNGQVPAGDYTVTVTATRGALKSESASLDITVLAYDGDLILEAEHATLDGGKNVRNNAGLHGGAYVGGIDDCGQGLYFRYFAYEAGERTVDVCYATATPDSFMKLFVNGELQKTATFTENTGWLGVNNTTTAKTSVKLNFARGWNEIYLIKDGVESDTPAYGGNAEIDYIEIHGSGKSYAADEFDKSSDSYKLEAEVAGWHWADKNRRPANWGEGCSLGYALGEINEVGDGVKYTFELAESGLYKVQVAYGSGMDGIKFNVKVNDGDPILRERDRTGSHNIFVLDEGIDVRLEAGTVTIDVGRAENSNWLTFDYVLVTKIDHSHAFTAQNTDDKYLKSAATCLDKAVYYYSCAECGEAGAQTFEYGEPNGHEYDESVPAYDDEVHYYAATCEHTDERKNVQPHKLVTDTQTNTVSCEDCGYTAPYVTELPAPANLAYADGTLTFDGVEKATSYAVEIKKGEQSVHSSTVTETRLDVAALGLDAGKYTVTVIAKCGGVASDAARLEINVLITDGDVVIEAEDAVLNGDWHVRYNDGLHGGAYAGGINDCGQGLYFRYYAYEAGERAVEVYYATGTPNSFMKSYINGTYQKNIVFTENTGWLSNDNTTTAKVTATLEFVQGWNEFYLIKDGTDSDNPQYGGNAEIDYIVVKGSGKSYDATQFDTSSDSYKLEAEVAGWHWQNGDVRPTKDGQFSLGYYCGSMDNAGDGVKFTFKVAESGTYKLQLAYGGGGDTAVKYSVNGGDALDITLKGSTAWNNVVPSENAIALELTAGETVTVDFMQAGTWFVPDYLLVTKVAQ